MCVLVTYTGRVGGRRTMSVVLHQLTTGSGSGSEHMAKQLMLILSSALRDEKELEHQEGPVDP